MLLSNCVVCRSKKSKFIKEQVASRLLSSLGIKTPLNNITLLDRLFVLRVFNKLIQDIK